MRKPCTGERTEGDCRRIRALDFQSCRRGTFRPREPCAEGRPGRSVAIVVRASRPQDGPRSFKTGLRARRAHHNIAPEDFELLWCGRLARMVMRCLGDPQHSTGEPLLDPGLLGRPMRPGVAPTPVTLSEGVPPSESKGPPKYGTMVRTASRCRPPGDSSTRFARSQRTNPFRIGSEGARFVPDPDPVPDPGMAIRERDRDRDRFQPGWRDERCEEQTLSVPLRTDPCSFPG